MNALKVGEAAAAIGISARAIRLWQAKGLIPASDRSEVGYRLFTERDLDRLRFIRQAKDLGLTLGEIKRILDLRQEGATPCPQVATLLEAHIAAIDRALADLHQLRATLTGARDHADELAGDGVICAIIERRDACPPAVRHERDRANQR